MKNIQIGRNIHMLRELMGLSQSCLATFLGIDQSNLSKIETGERPISSESLEKLSTVFGVSVDALEGQCVTPASMICAFRKRDFTPEDLEVVSAINRIAMNLDFMQALVERGEGKK